MSQQLLEHRSFACRATVDAESESMVIHGTAIVFETWQKVAEAGQAAYSGSERLREKIAKGALRIDVSDQQSAFVHTIKSLINHDPQKYLGSTKTSLKLKQTDQGLDFEITVPQTTLGLDTIALAKAEGTLPVSIGFVGRGRRSNVAKKPLAASRAAIDAEKPPPEIDLGLPVPKTQPPDHLLDGSDYTEGIDQRNGIRWRVYHTIDLREISILQGLDPAWRGVSAKVGKLDSNQARAKAVLEYYTRSHCDSGYDEVVRNV